MLAIGPVAVDPAVQRRGVGSALMHAAMSLAVARGVPALVLLGHPTYYPRFGFEPARGAGLEPPADAWPDAGVDGPPAARLERRRCAGHGPLPEAFGPSPEARPAALMRPAHHDREIAGGR